MYMKHDIEMGSGAMIHVPNFMNVGSGLDKFIQRDIQTHSMVISGLLLFFSQICKVVEKRGKCMIREIFCDMKN